MIRLSVLIDVDDEGDWVVEVEGYEGSRHKAVLFKDACVESLYRVVCLVRARMGEAAWKAKFGRWKY